MDIVRCPRCAKEVPDASRFCRRCGCSLAFRSATFTAPVVPPEIPPLPPLPHLYDNRRGGGVAAATVTRRPATRRTPPQAKNASGGGGGVVVLLGIGAAFMLAQSSVRPKGWCPPPAPRAVTERPYAYPRSFDRIERPTPPVSHPLPLNGGVHRVPTFRPPPEPPASRDLSYPARGPDRGQAQRYRYVPPGASDPYHGPGQR
jgi:hypothetical protein